MPRPVVQIHPSPPGVTYPMISDLQADQVSAGSFNNSEAVKAVHPTPGAGSRLPESVQDALHGVARDSAEQRVSPFKAWHRHSSIGRVAVSKSAGWGFDSLCLCHALNPQVVGSMSSPHAMHLGAAEFDDGESRNGRYSSGC